MSIIIKLERIDREPEFHEFPGEYEATAFINDQCANETTMYISRFDEVSRIPGDFEMIRRIGKRL